MRGAGLRTLLAVAACLVLASCSSASPPALSSPGSPSRSSAASSPAGSPSPTPSRRATLAGCPAAAQERALPTFARPEGRPDDLVAAPDGSLWVSEVDDDLILHLAADGHVLARIADPGGPEGMVLLDDGRLIVADQKTNRIVAYSAAAGGAPQTIAVLPTSAGALGVDGIGFDRAGGRLLVPDSPVGSLLAISVRDGSVTTLSTGLGRAVGADVGPDGAIYVVAESSAGLLRVPGAGGPAQRVGTLTQLDDVVSRDGLLYVTALGGALFAVDPSTAASRQLVSGGSQLQGLAALPDGRLAVADETARVVFTADPCA